MALVETNNELKDSGVLPAPVGKDEDRQVLSDHVFDALQCTREIQ